MSFKFLFEIILYISATTSDNREQIQKSSKEKSKAPTPISGAGNIIMEKNDEALEAPARSYNTIEQKEEEELPQNTTATALFHLVMVFVAFYFAMLLTNWGSPNMDVYYKNYTEFSKEWLGMIIVIIRIFNESGITMDNDIILHMDSDSSKTMS